MRWRSALVVAGLLVAGCNRDDAPTVSGDVSTTTDAKEPTREVPSGTAPQAGDPLNGFVPAPLEWDGCGRQVECATLVVPLDWADPDGVSLELAVTRLPATGDDPLGAVAFNPGGPGAAANEYLRAGGIFDDAIAERFDTVAWDPRGVGESEPLGCDGAEVDAFARLDSDPDSAEEQAALDDAARAVAERCRVTAGDRLPFMGTASVARDLEAIRRAYGAPMAYVGFSYGTAIGLHHLELFPGAMTPVVLDGVVDPAHSQTDLLRGQTEAFDRVIERIFAACPDGEDECPPGGAERAYDTLAEAVERDPIPAGDGEVGPSELTTAAIFVTYEESLWPQLYDGLSDALDGDGSTLLALAEGYREIGFFDAYQAVSCVDSANPAGAEAWAAFAAELEAISPRFGAAVANEMLPCAFWPAPPAPVNRAITAPGSGPVLVVGTTNDAATPLAQAERVAATLEDGHLLVHDGDGHTAYFTSRCVQEAVATFLIDGAVPAEGDRC